MAGLVAVSSLRGVPVCSAWLLYSNLSASFHGSSSLFSARISRSSKDDCRGRGVISCEVSSEGKTSSNSGRKPVGIQVIDRDENGNMFIRTARVGERISFLPPGGAAPFNFPRSGSEGQLRSDPNRSPSSREKSKQKRSSVGAAGAPSSAAKGRSQVLKPPTTSPSKPVVSSRRAVAVKVSSGPPQYSKAARRFYNERFRKPERLAKVLAASGVASRRNCEDIVFAGRVSVNGEVCKIPQTPVDPLKDVIYVDGNTLPRKTAQKLYFAVNKPKGYICSSAKDGTKPVLTLLDDYFKIWSQRNPGFPQPRMFTVGRLDVATSGLLLVTNDGDFANKVSHPSSGLTKEYIVTVKDKVTRRQLTTIAEGTLVQGVMCVPKMVEQMVAEPGESKQRIRVVVSEGRNHEVRNLVENAGLQILALKRTRIGGLSLSRKLGVGKFEDLTEAQAQKVLDKNAQTRG